MISFIYKSRLFKYLIYFFIGVLINGCYTTEIVKSYNLAELDASSVKKIDLKDGKTIDFTDKNSLNRLIKIDENELVYKDSIGNSYTISSVEIARLYQGSLDVWKTFLVILAAGIVFFALAFPSLIERYTR